MFLDTDNMHACTAFNQPVNLVTKVDDMFQIKTQQSADMHKRP